MDLPGHGDTMKYIITPGPHTIISLVAITGIHIGVSGTSIAGMMGTVIVATMNQSFITAIHQDGTGLSIYPGAIIPTITIVPTSTIIRRIITIIMPGMNTIIPITMGMVMDDGEETIMEDINHIERIITAEAVNTPIIIQKKVQNLQRITEKEIIGLHLESRYTVKVI